MGSIRVRLARGGRVPKPAYKYGGEEGKEERRSKMCFHIPKNRSFVTKYTPIPHPVFGLKEKSLITKNKGKKFGVICTLKLIIVRCRFALSTEKKGSKIKVKLNRIKSEKSRFPS